MAKGGDVTLYYDGEAVGKGRVERSQPMGYSANEALRRRFRQWLAGLSRLRAKRERLHRCDRMGADRPRR